MTQKKSYPAYMRSSVSPQFLAKNPIYQKIFSKCPICNNLSLKPIGIERVADISQVMKSKDRKCAVCGYTHIKDLVVSTATKASNESINTNNMVIKEGRILEDQNKK